ncbi:hypothetical protein EVC37_20285 [Methylocaldum sp. BRCS4]|jgi:uncharacterized membrane protein|uniref:general stress protein n=1 Tax=Methylocaldum sp. TaxID=1969727 RepID=UPI0012EB2FBD|nr:hypothetical protein [Methylocaldum sp. BRCS4]
MSPGRSVVSVYDSMSKIEEAIQKLNQEGFPINQVSMVARSLESEREVHGIATIGDMAKHGASIGTWTGGLFGVLVGAALVWVPGGGSILILGPLTVALITSIEGALVGAAGGGLLGALVGFGVSTEHIIRYEQHVKGGKYLLIAHGSAEELEWARDLLADTGAEEITMHQSESTAR